MYIEFSKAYIDGCSASDIINKNYGSNEIVMLEVVENFWLKASCEIRYVIIYSILNFPVPILVNAVSKF